MTEVLVVPQESVNRFLKNAPGATAEVVERWKTEGVIKVVENE